MNPLALRPRSIRVVRRSERPHCLAVSRLLRQVCPRPPAQEREVWLTLPKALSAIIVCILQRQRCTHAAKPLDVGARLPYNRIARIASKIVNIVTNGAGTRRGSQEFL